MMLNDKKGRFEKEIRISMRYSKPDIAREFMCNDTALLEKASNHIFYEISLFLLTYDYFRITNTYPPQLLEVFLLHTRNLYNFFYPAQDIIHDDMCVYDFLDNYGIFNKNIDSKNSFVKLKIAHINKFVSHLTYERCKYDYKEWPCLDIGSKMIKTIKVFYDALPDDY